jgi:F420-dependent oxidoreductase-like protein
MRYGMSLGGGARSFPSGLESISILESAGLDSAWCGQLFGVDALTLYAVAGTRTSRIMLGTSVIPTYSRHPLVLASQALTTQAATGGRLILGLGSSHRALVEGALGLNYERPAAYLREYLEVLGRLLGGERFEYHGQFLHIDTTTVFGPAGVSGADAPPVYVGTMFPLSLRVAGELADGIITWLVSPRTLTDQVIPTLYTAADDAGRPRPKVISGIPIAVCAAADAEKHVELVNRRLGGFMTLPVYAKVLAREQDVPRPGELAAIGDEETVATRIREHIDAGVDELYGICFGDDVTFRRTAALLGELARSGD